MTGAGHTLTGVLAGIPLAALSYKLGAGVTGSLACLATCTLASTAPDWLEIPYRATKTVKDVKGKEVVTVVTKRLLKHRGITHIILAWVAAFLWSFVYLKAGSDIFGWTDLPKTTVAILFGFFAGGVLHLMGDLPNKQKVPILTPWDGISLNIWKSGEFERTTGALLLSATAAFVYFEDPIYTTVINIIN